jgi:hypothetical protein
LKTYKTHSKRVKKSDYLGVDAKDQLLVYQVNLKEKKNQLANLTNELQKYRWKLIVVLDYSEAIDTYSRIGILRSYLLNTYKLVLETYGRIGLLRSYENLQSYWTTSKLWKLTVVLDYFEAILLYNIIITDEGGPTGGGGALGGVRN